MRVPRRLIGLFAFLILMGAAMWVYPGGNPFDSSEPGHSFWQNFLCDLFSQNALNGEPNRAASILAAGAMLVFLLGVLLPTWWRRDAARTPGSYLPTRRALGAAATASALAVFLGPALGWEGLHDVATVIASSAGVTATVLSALADREQMRRRRWLGWLGVLAIAAAVLNLVMYGRVAWFGAELTPALPAVQKIAALLAIAWLGLWIAAPSRAFHGAGDTEPPPEMDVDEELVS